MPGVFRLPVTLTWDDPGSPGANVWHIDVAAGGDEQTRLQDAVDAIHDFYGFFVGGATSPMRKGTVMTAEFATDLDANEQREIDWDPMTANAGSAGDAPMVCQVVIGWRTASASRRGRGRTFVGPLSTNALDTDGTVSAASLTALGDAATNLVAASTAAAEWSVGVYGLVTSGGGPSSPHIVRPFTGFRIRDTLAVLRSRRD